jgi:acetyl esterase/lipase
MNCRKPARKGSLVRAALAALVLARCASAYGAPDKEFVGTSHVYKTVGDTKIEADVYGADDQVRPAVVWIHGGALIVGNRKSVPRQLSELCRREGFVLVSIDYRLAPEVKLPEIAGDVRDALHWIRTEGARRFHFDPDRIAVTGGSAGGYLTLLCGTGPAPRPRALVAYWGYGDIDSEWYTKPSEHYRKSAPLVSRDEALKAVGGVRTGTDGEAGKARGRYYLYLRQNGLWTRDVSGIDPAREPHKLDPYCPIRNVTSEYPPTLLIHGTEDTDVPYEQSAQMAQELARHKVPHELITVKGAGHGLSHGDKKAVADAHARALEFLREHLK